MTSGDRPRPCPIRRAAPRDLDRLVDLDESVFGLESLTRSQLYHYVTRSPSLLWVAVTPSDLVVGMTLVGLRRGRSFARIDSLLVDVAFRRRGIARALLHRAIQTAEQERLKAVILEVEPKNRNAIELYHDEGFEALELVADYYGSGRPALRMRLEL
ncbi:MAG: N-acetyltransferase [Planctomycetota bacterium]